MSNSFNVLGPLANESIPLKHVLGCGGGGGWSKSGGGDLTLNSLFRTWLSPKQPLSFKSLQAARVYGQLQCVFLMDLNVSFANQEPRRESP